MELFLLIPEENITKMGEIINILGEKKLYVIVEGKVPNVGKRVT